jgi:hypothetical protein
MTLPSREHLRQSELVFKAKITKIGASTMPEMPADETTIVVAVEEVYQAPEVLRSLAGKSITVVTRDSGSLLAGQDVLFLAKGWLYGESIAVVEIGRESGEVDYSDLRRYVNAEAEAVREEALHKRVGDANLIVAGNVVSLRPVQVLDLGNASEHTPMWTEATIQVSSVEKGTLPTTGLHVVYPASMDVKWYRTPKFQVGEEGIWILQRRRIEELGRDAFTALNTLDFHSMDELERIRRLIHAVK